MKLSVITICHNDPDIQKTCESIANQTHRDFEWIVIDGGSDKETIDVLNKYRDRINVFVSEKDYGIYNAMNKGIKLASGDYLQFLNAGDLYFDNTSLEKIHKFLMKEDIIYGNLQFITPQKRFIKEYPDNIPYSWFISESLPHPACFIKKELFDKYGLYNENYKIVSDWEKWIEFIDINRCSYKHIPITVSIHNHNGISSVLDETHLKERAEIITKYYGIEEDIKPTKKVVKFLGIPLLKVIKNFHGCNYYLFGLIPIYKKINKEFPKAKVICTFNNQEIFENVVKNNEHLKNCEIISYNNIQQNIAITKHYNDFIKENIDNTDSWYIFMHQDFGIKEDLDLVLKKLNQNHIYGPIGVKIFKGIFWGKQGQNKKTGLKNELKIAFGRILQGNNDFNFTPKGKRIFHQITVDSIDCCCIIIHSSLIKKYDLRFDENLKFHMYAEDFCYRGKKNYKIKTKVVQMKCFHMGAGNLGEEFQESVQYLKDKFNLKKIPSTCPN